MATATENAINEEIKRSEPENKRAMVFIQADILWQEAHRMFGINHLDVMPDKLAKAICDREGWELSSVYVYVARQTEEVNPKWYSIWNRLMRVWSRDYGLDVRCFPWSTKFLNVVNNKRLQDVRDIYSAPVYVGDRARNAMICDIISKANDGEFDVCVLVTRDPDLEPVADEIRNISFKKKIWLKAVNAFPYEKEEEGEKVRNFRGINHTDWLHIDWDMYDKSCYHGDSREPDSDGQGDSDSD